MRGQRVGERGQSKALINHLKAKGSITSMEAFNLYGITRISALIFSLRDRYNIETVMVDTTNRYGEHTRYGRFYYRGEK
jgi:hypothetical protein